MKDQICAIVAHTAMKSASTAPLSSKGMGDDVGTSVPSLFRFLEVRDWLEELDTVPELSSEVCRLPRSPPFGADSLPLTLS
jgi:hypothetical protein